MMRMPSHLNVILFLLGVQPGRLSVPALIQNSRNPGEQYTSSITTPILHSIRSDRILTHSRSRESTSSFSRLITTSRSSLTRNSGVDQIRLHATDREGLQGCVRSSTSA